MIGCWTNKQAYNQTKCEPIWAHHLLGFRKGFHVTTIAAVCAAYLYCNLMALLVGVAWALVSTALLETNTNKCSFLSHFAPMQLSSRLDTFRTHNCSSSSLNGFSETPTRFNSDGSRQWTLPQKSCKTWAGFLSFLNIGCSLFVESWCLEDRYEILCKRTQSCFFFSPVCSIELATKALAALRHWLRRGGDWRNLRSGQMLMGSEGLGGGNIGAGAMLNSMVSKLDLEGVATDILRGRACLNLGVHKTVPRHASTFLQTFQISDLSNHIAFWPYPSHPFTRRSISDLRAKSSVLDVLRGG